MCVPLARLAALMQFRGGEKHCPFNGCGLCFLPDLQIGWQNKHVTAGIVTQQAVGVACLVTSTNSALKAFPWKKEIL